MKGKKMVVSLALSGIVLFMGSIAFATEYVGGGTWDHGLNSKIVWSYYQHKKVKSIGHL